MSPLKGHLYRSQASWKGPLLCLSHRSLKQWKYTGTYDHTDTSINIIDNFQTSDMP